MRESRKSGSVGGRGGKPPWPTRPRAVIAPGARLTRGGACQRHLALPVLARQLSVAGLTRAARLGQPSAAPHRVRRRVGGVPGVVLLLLRVLAGISARQIPEPHDGLTADEPADRKQPQNRRVSRPHQNLPIICKPPGVGAMAALGEDVFAGAARNITSPPAASTPPATNATVEIVASFSPVPLVA